MAKTTWATSIAASGIAVTMSARRVNGWVNDTTTAKPHAKTTTAAITGRSLTRLLPCRFPAGRPNFPAGRPNFPAGRPRRFPAGRHRAPAHEEVTATRTGEHAEKYPASRAARPTIRPERPTTMSETRQTITLTRVNMHP